MPAGSPLGPPKSPRAPEGVLVQTAGIPYLAHNKVDQDWGSLKRVAWGGEGRAEALAPGPAEALPLSSNPFYWPGLTGHCSRMSPQRDREGSCSWLPFCPTRSSPHHCGRCCAAAATFLQALVRTGVWSLLELPSRFKATRFGLIFLLKKAPRRGQVVPPDRPTQLPQHESNGAPPRDHRDRTYGTARGFEKHAECVGKCGKETRKRGGTTWSIRLTSLFRMTRNFESCIRSHPSLRWRTRTRYHALQQQPAERHSHSMRLGGHGGCGLARRPHLVSVFPQAPPLSST